MDLKNVMEQDVAECVDSSLKDVSKLLQETLNQQTLVAELEDALSHEKEKLKTLEENTLPEKMAVLGYKAGSKIVINGVEVKLAEQVQMSISKDQKPVVIDWLKKSNNESFVSNEIVVDVPKGVQPDELKELLRERGYSFIHGENCNTTSVKALVRGLLEEEKESNSKLLPDLSTIGARTFIKATIKIKV